MRDRPVRVSSGLIARRRQFGNAILKRRIAHIEHAVLDCFIEPLEFGFGLGCPTLKISDMKSALGHPVVPAFEDLVHQRFQPCRFK
ncbi:hypothetical protein ACPVPU_12570 [Sphingomonas sp. CJ99]